MSVLDLSTNLISSWESVLELFGESDGVCRMSTLILSDNRFTIADSEPNPQNQLRQLPSINTLVLNSCGRLNMDDVLIIGKYLPNLRALHLCNNHISRLSNQSPLGKKQSMLSVFAKLETLDLENNELSDWRDVLDACGDLPALKTLLLSGNCIQSVSKDNGAVDARQHFTSLRCLALGSNNISSWESVDALNTFTSLEELRLSDNPLELAKQSAEGIRYHIIARVPSLKVLNGGSISLAERHDAELAFLGWTRQGSPGINHHPRVMELRAKYGLEDLGGGDGSVDHAAGVQTQGRTLASSMVTLTFVSSTSGQLKKRVPTTLTIGRLRLLCERLLRVKIARDQPIVLIPPGQSDTERIFEEIAHHLNDRELAYFGVDTDGWSVYVDHVDHQLDGFKPSSGQQAVQKDLQRRLEAQESGWRRLREEERRLLLSSGNPATVNVAANSSARQLRDLT